MLAAVRRSLAGGGIVGLVLAAGLSPAAGQAVDPLAATVDRKAAGSNAANREAQVSGARTGPLSDTPLAPAPAPATPAASTGTAAVSAAASAASDPNLDPDSDEAVLERLPELSTNYLADLLGLYHRLKNPRMINAVTAELRQRDPSGKILADVLAALPNNDPGGPGVPDSPFDAIEDKADRLMNLGQPGDAVVVLEQAKAKLSRGGNFPLEGQLGAAYLASGRKEEAAASFRHVAASSAYPEVVRNEARGELAQIQLSDAIADAYATMLAGDREQAVEMARGLSAANPGNPDVELLLGQTLSVSGNHREALPILERLKSTTPAGQSFSGQADYADALYNSNQLEAAKTAYDELENDPSQPETLRYEARRTSQEIYRKTANQVRVDTEYLKEADGELILGEVEASAQVRQRLRIGASGWYDYVSLDPDSSLRRTSTSNIGGYAYGVQQIGSQHFMDVRLGSADHGKIIYGLGLGRQAPNELFWGWKAGYYGNDRAVDSLPLIALNGRENRIEASVGGPLPFGLKLKTRGAYRQVYAEDADLGDGFIADIEVSRFLWRDTARKRALSLAYEGLYERFDSRTLSTGESQSLGLVDPAAGALFAAELIQPRYNGHGGALTFDHKFSDRWGSYLTLGAVYNFELEQFDWYSSGGLTYLIRDNLELLLEAAYYSDGTALANSASEIIVANLGLRYYY